MTLTPWPGPGGHRRGRAGGGTSGGGAGSRCGREASPPRCRTRQELLLTYQPILDLDTTRLTGMEVLVRWMHPERGLIQPLDFIPLETAAQASQLLTIGADMGQGYWFSRPLRAPVMEAYLADHLAAVVPEREATLTPARS